MLLPVRQTSFVLKDMTSEGAHALSTEFQIFISSTVEDLKPVRKKLLCALEQPGRLVRCSEDPRFPVEPGMTSHDACLAVVRRCHAFVLLIGARFGGEYQNQGKSITWREWEEACLAGLTPIILVNRKTNGLCRFIAKERARRRAVRPADSDQDIDHYLEKRFGSQFKGYHHAPALQRFVDAVRKGHTDNWKLDWSGSATEAIKYVNQNLAVQAAAAERRRQEARDLLQATGRTLVRLSQIGSRVAALVAEIRRRRIEGVVAVQGLLDLVASFRTQLFGFRDGDRYTVVVHELRRGKLHPVARAAHPDVLSRNRVWSLGEGHVGQSVQHEQMMVSGDIRATRAWVHHQSTEATDRMNYVSVMARPYFLSNGKPGGTATLTSSRVDHFTNSDQPYAIAFDMVVSFINMIISEAK
jgi:hypothetical protein